MCGIATIFFFIELCDCPSIRLIIWLYAFMFICQLLSQISSSHRITESYEITESHKISGSHKITESHEITGYPEITEYPEITGYHENRKS